MRSKTVLKPYVGVAGKVSIKDTKETKERNKTEREKFCEENGIAIADIIDTCVRLNDSSKDSQLLVHSYTPIIQILRAHPSIETIIITAKSLGSSANHHFYQYLVKNEIEFELDASGEMPCGRIRVDERGINIFSIDSTSKGNSHVKDDKLVELYQKAFGLI